MRTDLAARVLLLAAVLVTFTTAVPASAARPLRLKVPRFEVPPRSDREICAFVRLPTKKPFDAAGTLVVNVGGAESFTSHHFLAYAYTGSDLAGFPPDGTVVDSKACLDFGPADRNSRVLIALSQTPKKLDRLPLGLAQRILPAVSGGRAQGIGVILNSHWINGSDKTHHASVKMKLLPAKPGTVRRYLKPIFETLANGFLDVAPGTEAPSQWFWQPGQPDFASIILGGSAPIPTGPACVESLTSHTHKRGKSFTIDLVRENGAREQMLQTLEYSDPQEATFDGQHGHPAPLLIGMHDRLEYRCVHDNGKTTQVKLGCEEVAGEAPGKGILQLHLRTDGAAKRCSHVGPASDECPPTDPAYPGRSFTGNCVEANLVFGFTSDDDMCIMPGAYYDANPDAPPGRECDLSLLPALP
jgi:hypothetical protein